MNVSGHRSTITMRCEFDVPDELFATEADERRRLDDVRRALDVDSRWSGSRVAAIRQADPRDGWHVNVWTIPLSGSTEHLARTCQGVCDTVCSIIAGANLLACSAGRLKTG